MGLKRFNLDKKELKGGSSLVHGNYASGKSHLIGDFLRTEREFGDIAFLDIVGEDGSSSCANFGLGEKGIRIESIADAREFIEAYRGNKLAGIGLDSLPALYSLSSGTWLKKIVCPRWSRAAPRMSGVMYIL